MKLADLFGRQRSATTAHHRLQVLLMHERCAAVNLTSSRSFAKIFSLPLASISLSIRTRFISRSKEVRQCRN